MAKEDSAVLADRLASARLQYFVGRQRELALFRRAAAGEPGAPTVVVLHGPGGIGKSALLQRFAAEARAMGRPVVSVDARTIDRSRSAFEAATAEVFVQDNAVLLVDDFERYRDMEEWIRDRFLPRLPAGALVVVAGRLAPDPLWKADLGWSELLQVVPLRELGPADSAALLTSQGVDPSSQAALLRFAAGHPLALRLAAEATTHDNTSTDEVFWAPLRTVVDRLLTHLVGKPPSSAHRRALEVCGHVADTTEELLRVALPDEDATELFAWLRQLSFMKSGPFGVRPYDVVRDALDSDFRWRDPERYKAMHRTVRRHLIERVREAPEKEALRAASEFNHIVSRAQWLREFQGDRAEGAVHEQPMRPEDAPALIELTRRVEGEHNARVVAHWLTRQPEAFHVHRRCDTGQLLGFMAWLRIDELDDETRAADPVTAEAWDLVSSMTPPRQGEHLGVARFMVHEENHHRPSRSWDLVRMRIVFELLRAKHCAWSCFVSAEPKFWAPLMTYMGMFQPPRQAVHADRGYGLFCHDWRAARVEEWAEGIDARLLGGAPAVAAAKPNSRLTSLSREESDAAVREALRGWLDPGGLADNPLLRSRLVEDLSEGDPVTALRDLIHKAVQRLNAHPRTRHLYEVLTATYHSTSTQEAVARKLNLAFSTYRRHLARALDEVRETVWDWEVHGRIRAEQEPPQGS
ncbi:AAA ATPase domain-containing protein [Streptomyces sp. 3213]|uniref:ATP-binding protein n=1 Tax=Streptomyces sp. 3213.3 TaxID=1855348 RepID=UPI000894713D|nr:ATP-binding protein [Streptomyces sp. 3213.3]SEE66197.1 AAA ATPase domain-containing protein [Streptomyces sp. 3213] [Streptomyces sp. 3213.3]